MASAQAFWDGFQFLILGVIISLALLLFVGFGVDGIITEFETMDIFDVSDPWRSAGAVDMYFWQRFSYIIAVSPAVLGVIAQILAAVQRERVEETEFMNTQFREEGDI